MKYFIGTLIVAPVFLLVGLTGYKDYMSHQPVHILCIDHGISVYIGDAYDVTNLNSGVSFRTSNIGTLVVVLSGACAIQEIK